jgi:hypothetical protein
MRHDTVKVTSVIVSTIVLAMVSLLSGVGPSLLNKVSAAELGSRFLELSDNTSGANSVTYNTSFQITTAGTLGSVAFEFCSNSTLPADPCNAPAGMNVSNAVFTQESGISGFTIRSATANEILISRPPSAIGAVNATAIFDNITNPSSAGSYYLRVLTYPTMDGSGPYTDNGGMAIAITSPINVQAQVPPYLYFCTGNTISGIDCSTALGDFIELGQLLPTQTSSGQSQMVVATNAKNGYSIATTGSTLTSGNNIIPSLSVDSPSQVGISQFGINLRANTKPTVGADPVGPGGGLPTVNYDQPNLYQYVNGDIVATNNSVEGGRKYTVSYVTNISKSQPSGVYASTFTYVAMSNF